MADFLTLTQIISGVRSKMNDASLDEDKITTAANDFQNQLFTDHRMAEMEASEDLSLADGESEVEFPDDALNIITITAINSDEQAYPLRKLYIPYEDFMGRFPDWETASENTPLYWTTFGRTIRFANPANADYTIRAEYIRHPEDMAQGSDESAITTTYRQMMVLGVCAILHDQNEDYDYGEQERVKLDGLIAAWVRNGGRGLARTGPVVMRSNRRGAPRSDWGLRSEW